MTDIEQKRAFVGELYPGPRWKKQVDKMPDSQVIAIYMREMAHPHNNDDHKEESEDDGTPF